MFRAGEFREGCRKPAKTLGVRALPFGEPDLDLDGDEKVVIRNENRKFFFLLSGREKKMAVVYPSDGWIKELQKICRADPDFKDACGDFAGTFIFQVESEPGKLDKTAYLFLWADQGDVREALALSSTDEKPDAEYIITGKYSVWKDVVTGKQEPLRALMTRKLKLIKGSQLKVLKQVKLALRMMHNSTRVEATFADENT